MSVDFFFCGTAWDWDCLVGYLIPWYLRFFSLRRSPTFDFTVSQPYVCDGTFVVDGVRLHVSKAVSFLLFSRNLS